MQDIQVPGDSVISSVRATPSLSSSSSSSSSATPIASSVPAVTALDGIGKDGSSIDRAGEDARNDHSATDSDGSTEHVATATAMHECDDGGRITPHPPAASSNYSHKDLRAHDVFWTCSLEEFHAMSDAQWASFGTAFYTPPAGFNSATKHVVQLE